MTKEMTRNAFYLLVFLSLSFPSYSFATVESPVVQGLGGGGRAGVPQEALYSNPAAVAQIKNSFGFVHYVLPKIPDFRAGGRGYSVGLYDGGSEHLKGGFGYSRVSKARIVNGNKQGYDDRSEFRFATAHVIMGQMIGGLQTRYVRTHSNPDSGRYLDGNLGIIFPLFADITGGLTWENALNKEDELPSTLAGGAAYHGLGYGITLFADGYRLMSGTRGGERGWSLAAEFSLAGDFKVRGGLFEEAFRNLKGWSVGLSWGGPRLSLDYALRTAGGGPKEKEHIFGLTSVF